MDPESFVCKSCNTIIHDKSALDTHVLTCLSGKGANSLSFYKCVQNNNPTKLTLTRSQQLAWDSVPKILPLTQSSQDDHNNQVEYEQMIVTQGPHTSQKSQLDPLLVHLASSQTSDTEIENDIENEGLNCEIFESLSEIPKSSQDDDTNRCIH